jgi:NAD(P)-dependent dehydrogenase (short-subunit alcohol dehydrogenase family)
MDAPVSVIIVTGGTFGIGRAISTTLAARGHAVVAFGLDARQPMSYAENGSELLRADARAAGLAIDVHEADVSSAADVERVVAWTKAKHGRIDGLVNNAAIGPIGTILETSEELWDRVIDVNLKGTFLACKAVLPQMIAQGGGSIVNIGSGSGWGKPGMLAYAASKGGIFALGAALAYDHFHDRIRVNTVIPRGGVFTGIALGRVGGDPARFDPAVGMTAAGRSVTPEDIARTVAFLFSADAEVLSGAVIDVGSFAHQGGPLPARGRAPDGP